MENKRNLKQIINTLTLVLIVIAVFVIFSTLNHAFASRTNIMNIVRQVSVNGILAVGMTLVCLTGGIDLSVGSILGYAGIWTATWAQAGTLPVPGIFRFLLEMSGIRRDAGHADSRPRSYLYPLRRQADFPAFQIVPGHR